MNRFLVLLVIPLFGLADPSPVQAQPAVGDIFDARPGDQFRGWAVQVEASGLHNAPYGLFSNGDVTMIALVEPVVTTSHGGISVKRITQTLVVRATPGETTVDGFDCPFLSVSPAIAFFSPSTRIARGFFVMPGEIRQMRWLVDDPHGCEYSGD